MVGDPVMAWRAQGIAAARRGDRAAARAMLDQALRLDTQDADSWFWLAAVQPDPYQARALLIQVLILNPYHARARAGLAAGEAQLAPPGVPPSRGSAAAASPGRPTSGRPAASTVSTPCPPTSSSTAAASCRPRTSAASPARR